MPVRDLMPWRKREGSDQLAVKDHYTSDFMDLHREMNRLFESFFGESMLDLPRMGVSFNPGVDVIERDKEIVVKADLPGMDEGDIEVTLDDNSLILKGEKKEEKEEDNKGVHRLERTFGSFYRRVPIPSEIDPEKVEAKFKKGVLHVTMPKVKSESPKSVKISVK